MNKITTRTIISPAYARDYKSLADVVDAFESGTDFFMESIGFGGRYCSIRDFAPGTEIEIRYYKKQRVVIYKMKPDAKQPSVNLYCMSNFELREYAGKLAAKLARNMYASCNERNRQQVQGRESKIRLELARVEAEAAKRSGCELWSDYECD